MARVVIIGAGLTGLSTAYHLQQVGITDCVLLEQESQSGGLCRSVICDGFTFDYTGHLLHAPDRNIDQIKKLAPSLNLIQHTRNAQVYARHTWGLYPFQMHLGNLPLDVISTCVQEFITRPRIEAPTSFYDWALTHFGTGIAREFFWPFQRKVYAHGIRKVVPGWAACQAPQVNLANILDGIRSSKTSRVGSNAVFWYPERGGIQTFVHELVTQVRAPILFNHQVTTINLANKTVSCTNGTHWQYDVLVNTSSLRKFLSQIHDTSTSNFSQAHTHLCSSSVININLGIKIPLAKQTHWVYVPSSWCPFYRFSMPHLLSAHMTPTGCTSVSIEYAYATGQHPDVHHIAHRCQQSVQKILKFKSSDIIARTILQLPDAYSVYDTWQETNIPLLLHRLSEYNVLSVGRFGAWSYGSMIDAINHGAQVAKHII